MRRFLPGLGLLLAFAFAPSALAGEADAWAALAEGGKVVILRHARAPGPQQGREGDPPGFRLDDCATQRNLDAVGRKQATELGDMFRAHHVVVTRVMVSPWCRARDTANLMNLGPPPQEAKFLYNFGEHTAGAGAAVKEMPGPRMAVNRAHQIIQSWAGPGNLVMVSHGRTVVAVVFGDNRPSPEQGALYVLQPTPGAKEPFKEIGSIRAPD